jgi:hypothetical protein
MARQVSGFTAFYPTYETDDLLITNQLFYEDILFVHFLACTQRQWVES